MSVLITRRNRFSGIYSSFGPRWIPQNGTRVTYWQTSKYRSTVSIVDRIDPAKAKAVACDEY
jgi:hypothetical protein